MNDCMNSITNDILEGRVLLDSLTLEDFRKNRHIYSTFRQAQAPGFEASHLISLSKQRCLYNALHGTNYKNRRDFTKNVKSFDDRCYRYTPFEHVVDHYLLAKENPDEIQTFSSMVCYNFHKLPSDQQELLNSFLSFANLREIGFQNAVRNINKVEPWNKGKTMKEATGDPNWVDPKKGKTIKEITHNPNYVNPLKGVPKKSYLGEDYKVWNKGKKGLKRPEGWVNPVKGKSFADYHEGYVSPLKGRPNPYCSKLFKQRRIDFLKEKENGTFNGTWNEYQAKCRKERLG